MAFPDEVVKKYLQAGKIAAEVRERIKGMVTEGVPIIELCEKAEELIRRKGGAPAFPCNVSINEVAAHYTSPPGDTRTVPENSVVKVDIGVHIDGYIADTATTVCLNPEYESLVHTAEEALKTAVKILRPGLFTSHFGSAVQETIETRGFKPVSNLTGHKIGRYLIHAGKSLPNVSHISLSRVKPGEVYATEPFVTLPDAAGRIKSGKEKTIFRFRKQKRLKNLYAKQLLSYIQKNFRTLPFAERWIQDCVPKNQYETAFRELVSSKALIAYPVFIEASAKPVAQAEHTILIMNDKCIITTL